jgi:hypothetical protein
MSRYYFDTHDGVEPFRDDVGLDIETLEHVRRAAIEALPDMAREDLPDGEERTFRVSVRDEQGGVIFVAELAFRSGWLSGKTG